MYIQVYNNKKSKIINQTKLFRIGKKNLFTLMIIKKVQKKYTKQIKNTKKKNNHYKKSVKIEKKIHYNQFQFN